MNPSRRRLLQLAAASLAHPAGAAFAAPKQIGRARAKVVIIGGGAGGATLARILQKEAGDAIDTMLVEPQKNYTSSFHSNLVVGGFRSLASITHSYDAIRREGIGMSATPANGIDRNRKDVLLAGRRVAYDRLVLAPGIDLKFDSVPGYSESAAASMPHAWKTGAQAELLAKKLNAVRDGDTIVVIPPPNPARCPPAVYERVCMFAHVLKTKGHTKSKIVVLDTKPSFPLQPLFQEAWETRYPGLVEWQDPQMHGGIKRVDPASNEVVTDLATYKAALVNVIPAQMAPRIARDAELADATGFCPVDADTMKSSIDRNIFILGDAASAGDMPKAASSAVSQAKVAAAFIRSELADGRPIFEPHYAATCWSLAAPDDALKIGGAYAPRGGRIQQTASEISQKGESAETRKANAQASLDWYAGITADMFGA